MRSSTSRVTSRDAGFEAELLAATDERPNLVATLTGDADGPTLVYLGHVDTVLADPSEWKHDPWSGDLADGFLWGRGSLDMKSQVAAEAVAAASLARDGWRPARGTLKLVFVADEETGGDVGAHWLCEQHPDKVRCDMLLNEGGGEVFEYGGPPPLRRLLRREGNLPLQADGDRRRRARVAAAYRRQRAAEARAGAREDRRRGAVVRADRGSRGAAARAGSRPVRSGGGVASRSARPRRSCWCWSSRCSA